MKTNIIYNEDYEKGLERIKDKSINLLYVDPPYEQSINGGGCIKKNLIIGEKI